ncbi:protein GOLVEN 6-like [Macadamia integrifolia]|uniref:protein GOLVEN 6-like n=1 Tax=Macadamia integrifolia TaxID=60698 RepID=UPI001C4E88D6|nr:protein GOLVEN 6-like [Macadamia integrifolia]
MSSKGKMELLAIVTLCILSLLVTPCASHQTQVPSSLEQVHDLGISLTNLPRKLRTVEKPSIVKRCKTEVPKPEEPEANNKDFSGMTHSQVMLNGKEGTRQIWMERKDMWQFFTMDYSHVRRRQPVHNKSLPTKP